jgi:glyceraldehyde-3-phosphate dehydrogenase/erythrose-4-phosphate dehydrogenase
MSDWIKTGAKVILGVAGILAAAWVSGWSGSNAINSIFKDQREEVEKIIDKKILAVEDKAMAIRIADLNGINGRFDTIVQQNGTIIQQNYQVIKLLKEVKSDSITKRWKQGDQVVQASPSSIPRRNQ